MKIYKYWQIERQKLVIDNHETEVKVFGGSNFSYDDARAKAREKIEKIRQKIAGNRHAFDTYEVEIREEIVREVSATAVITRNRYGAQVLNVENEMIMDIDEPKSSFGDLFKKRDPANDKQKIIEMVRKLAQKPAYRTCGFRIYETPKGVRVIVMGQLFNPAASETDAMMRDFNCDNLYRILCKKQGCFRARLTPKPSRMKLRGYKVKFPREAGEEPAFQEWLAQYEAVSARYSACTFVEQIGSSFMPSEAIRVHDEISGANRSQNMA